MVVGEVFVLGGCLADLFYRPEELKMPVRAFLPRSLK